MSQPERFKVHQAGSIVHPQRPEKLRRKTLHFVCSTGSIFLKKCFPQAADKKIAFYINNLESPQKGGSRYACIDGSQAMRLDFTQIGNHFYQEAR